MTDVPVPFKGTREERELNRASHQWRGTADGVSCFACGCRATDVASWWPCGHDVPRMIIGLPERHDHRHKK